MKAKLQAWYYGEDGRAPFFRLRRTHIMFLIVFAAAAFFSFGVLKFTEDVLKMQLFGTTTIFSFVVILGFSGLLFGDKLALATFHKWPILLTAVVALFGGAFLGWLITPLYLLLAISDIIYCIRVHKTNPAPKEEPKFKNLTKK